MPEDPISTLAELRASGSPCALITVVGTSGSTPRKAGAKMVVTADSKTVGTIGGGKLEALAIAEAFDLLSKNESSPALRTYPLHEADTESFGAICGGEVILLTEAFPAARALVIVGAGHCGSAIAKIAQEIGFSVRVVDDRPDLLDAISADSIPTAKSLDDIAFFSSEASSSSAEPPLAFVAVSRNYETDLEALRRAAPWLEDIPFVGMIGSKRKVREVFETLESEGLDPKTIAKIHAPIGLDIGAESPGEIAISVIAQILAVTRGKPGGHLG